MAFTNIDLPDHIRARLDATRDEMARLHGLPDRWLAQALLNMARGARASHADLADPDQQVYGPAFLWHLVPEVARRLGGQLQPGEGDRYRHLDDYSLRVVAGRYLKHAGLGYYDTGSQERSEPSSLDLLDHDFVNGNPVAMAVDRIHPAPEKGQDGMDWIALHMREVSGFRGHGDVASWSPPQPPHLVASPAPSP